MGVKGRGERVQPSQVLANQDRQPGPARFHHAHTLAADQVLVDRTGQVTGQAPQLEVVRREVERVDLALTDGTWPVRASTHRFVRRR